MNPEKAIELVEDIAAGGNIRIEPDDVGALKLLIEAGKRLEGERALHTYPAYKLLPGETED